MSTPDSLARFDQHKAEAMEKLRASRCFVVFILDDGEGGTDLFAGAGNSKTSPESRADAFGYMIDLIVDRFSDDGGEAEPVWAK